MGEGQKELLRNHFKQVRSAMPPGNRKRIDSDIANRLLTLPEYQEAETVLAYLSFGSEVETRKIIHQAWAAGKRVLLPRCIFGTRTMAWHLVDDFEGLAKGPLGVYEPKENPATEVDIETVGKALALVPGLAFDSQGYRLGYGGGFYDVFLPRFTSTDATSGWHVAVGLCRSCQFVERMQALDAHDVPVTVVITEDEVYCIAGNR